MPLTSTGYTAPTLSEIIDETSADLRSDVSASLDLSTSTPDGQEVRIVARQLRRLYEGIQALYAGFGPNASGAMLRNISALTGTYQRGARATEVTVTLGLDAGTYAANTLTAHPTGRPDVLFRNRDTIVQAADGTASAVFVAAATGPLSPGTLVRGAPVAGWNSITTGVPTIGRDIEAEPALRLRRQDELEAQGAGTADAVRADILRQYPQAINVTVLENDTDSTDANGLPRKSIECIVHGPLAPTDADNQALAELILTLKGGGIQAHGAVTRMVRDSQGNTHAIGLTRPEEQEFDAAEIFMVVDPDTYIGDSAFDQQVITAINARSEPGRDLTWSALVSEALKVQGVLRVTNILIDNNPFDDWTINPRQYYLFAGFQDGINSTPGTP